jgi:hypothetical protein
MTAGKYAKIKRIHRFVAPSLQMFVRRKIDQPWKIVSIALRDWAAVSHSL